MTTEEFISRHRNADVRTLALQHSGRTDIDLPFALDQISGWQKARVKLPRWAATPGIVYPPHLAMEQCSSENTARYKAQLVRRLLDLPAKTPPPCADEAVKADYKDADLPSETLQPQNLTTLQPHNPITVKPQNPTTLIDLTGGFGVDFSYLAPMFGRAVYIERQSHLCDISRHNMAALGITQAEVVCGDSTQILEETGYATLIYIDPARRDSHGARTFAISDCTPDVLSLKETLLSKASFVMVKLSPMLDWRKAVADLGDCVGEVHIVSADGECKELLLVMSRKYGGLESVWCSCDGETLQFDPREQPHNRITPNPQNLITSKPHNPTTVQPHNPTTVKPQNPTTHLYIPNPSIMKAGCFALVGMRYGCRQVSHDSHIFVSPHAIPAFPGRGFVIDAVSSMNKRELRTALAGIDRANVSVRNFPMSADALRKRLKLKDGGDTYIFGTTAEDGTHLIFLCRKTQ